MFEQKKVYLGRILVVFGRVRVSLLVFKHVRKRIESKRASRSKRWETDGGGLSSEWIEQRDGLLSFRSGPVREWDNTILAVEKPKRGIKIGSILEYRPLTCWCLERELKKKSQWWEDTIRNNTHCKRTFKLTYRDGERQGGREGEISGLIDVPQERASENVKLRSRHVVGVSRTISHSLLCWKKRRRIWRWTTKKKQKES